ncbi:YbxH family protein [Bacillus sp. FJAT-27251]|uniref:YbxH family protein n=1 Tax=Bacillus sp. FJAT-27251 TaxID=1684142 RepID=UPI0006A7AF38|nr:YbxH family protein [Bacillus sp. FJAT-27251]
MGAVERNGYRFEPEYSVISQDGAVHVYRNGEFLEELKFSFSGTSPDPGQIEQVIDEYCETHGI